MTDPLDLYCMHADAAAHAMGAPAAEQHAAAEVVERLGTRMALLALERALALGCPDTKESRERVVRLVAIELRELFETVLTRDRTTPP